MSLSKVSLEERLVMHEELLKGLQHQLELLEAQMDRDNEATHRRIVDIMAHQEMKEICEDSGQ